jgi:hypothetical protein
MKARKSKATPPAGLVAMMSLVREGSENQHVPVSHAARAYPLALQAIADLRSRSNGEIGAVLEQAPDVFFEGIDEHDSGTYTQSEFYVGVAVAWLLLQELDGGAR